MDGFKSRFGFFRKKAPIVQVSTDNNSSPKIKRKKISKVKKKDPNVSIFNVHKKSKTKNNDISSSENSLEDLSKWKMSSEKQRKYSQKSLKSHSSPIKTCNEENMKEFSSPMATPKFRVQSNKLGIGPSPYRSPQTRCSAPIVTLAGFKSSLRYTSGEQDTVTKSPSIYNTPMPISSSYKQSTSSSSLLSSKTAMTSTPNRATSLSSSSRLPGLRAAFGGFSTPTKTDMKSYPRPPHDFAHNRSFELRLKNAEIMMAQERDKQQQLPKQRRWVTRRNEKSSSSFQSGEKNVSKLAECNRIAVYTSRPAPVPPTPAASPPYVCTDCSTTTVMNTSGLSETGDSGIFTSSYHSDHDTDQSIRLSVSQSFGKSFPDIHEDSEVPENDMDDHVDIFDDKISTSKSFSLSSSYTSGTTISSKYRSDFAPVKPKRSMITSYSNVNITNYSDNSSNSNSIKSNNNSNVRARVQMFESMSSSGGRKQSVSRKSTLSSTKSTNGIKGARTRKDIDSKLNEDKKKMSCTPNRTVANAARREASSTRAGAVMSSSPTSAPPPVMSISSSSSAASCGYKDFLIDDDYIDQQQLTFYKEVGQNSVEETLKEKMQSYLAHSKKDNETAVKSDDDKSMREVIKKDRTKDDDSCSLDTLSEQDSITSETEIDGIDHNVEDVAKPEEEIISNFSSQNEDIVQDVMDMNVLLCKLKSILMESGVMENNNIDLLGMEKVDRSEKNILDENNELKKQLISLQRNLEEKDKRINMLEMQLQKQIKNFSNNHVFTQT